MFFMIKSIYIVDLFSNFHNRPWKQKKTVLEMFDFIDQNVNETKKKTYWFNIIATKIFAKTTKSFE